MGFDLSNNGTASRTPLIIMPSPALVNNGFLFRRLTHLKPFSVKIHRLIEAIERFHQKQGRDRKFMPCLRNEKMEDKNMGANAGTMASASAFVELADKKI